LYSKFVEKWNITWGNLNESKLLGDQPQKQNLKMIKIGR
jgi:hypothetical protein